MQSLHRHQYDSLGPRDIRLLELRRSNLHHAELEGVLRTCRLLTEEDAASTEATAGAHNPLDLPLVAAGDFDALSYFWGGGEPTTHITIYDQTGPSYVSGIIPIKPNLEAALKIFRAQLATNEPEYFWIDALCINQTDDNEKSAQIQKIAHVYKMAKEVRIWLGPATPKSNSAIEFLQKLIDLDDIDELSNDKIWSKEWDSFRDLMRRDWFNRRWIIQEIALAKEAKVYCGEKIISWEQFMFAVSLFVEKAEEIKRLFNQSDHFHYHPDHLGEVSALGAKILVDVANQLFRKSDHGEVVEHLLSLEALMSTLTMFEASKPHDVVYSILWLANDATVGSDRSAALFPENAHTPIPSPTHGQKRDLSLIDPSLAFNLNVVESPTNTQAAINFGDGVSPRTLNKTPFEKTHTGSGGNGSNFLKPPEPARRNNRSRASSLSSLIRAEETEMVRPNPDPIVVNYNKSVYEVCKDFIEFAVMRSKSLDMICLPWAPVLSALDTMPSWIPTLEGRSFQLRPKEKVYHRVAADSLVGTPGRGDRIYRASGKQRARNTDPEKRNLVVDKALAAYGFVLDVVEEVDQKATEGIIPASWLKLAGWEDSQQPVPQRFWQTLVADRDVGGLKPPPAYFRNACVWAFNSRRTRGYNLNTRQVLHEGKCPSLAEKFLRRVQAVVWDRTLVLTKGTEKDDGSERTPKLLALVPQTAKPGDLICILYGCSVPVVLRKKELSVPDQSRPPKRQATKPVSPKGTLKRQKRSTMRSDSLVSESSIPSSYLTTPSTSVPPTRTNTTLDFGLGPSIPSPASSSGAQPHRNASNLSLDVLRNRYTLLGECYVHGMMAGEAFKHREDTGNDLQYFWLV